MAQYCSKKCQIKDWPNHKVECAELHRALELQEPFKLWEFAEKYESYHGYERIVKVFQNVPKYAYYVSFAYLNLGHYEKSHQVNVGEWVSSPNFNFLGISFALASIALRVATIQQGMKAHANIWQTFVETLLDQPSGSVHRRIANCDLVIEEMQKWYLQVAFEDLMEIEEGSLKFMHYLHTRVCKGGDEDDFEFYMNQTGHDVNLSRLFENLDQETRPTIEEMKKPMGHLLHLGFGFFKRCSSGISARLYGLYFQAKFHQMFNDNGSDEWIHPKRLK